MSKNWEQYKKAKEARTVAADKVACEFKKLFSVGDTVKFQRQWKGKVHYGTVLRVSADYQRLRIVNIETGSEYWIDSFWLVESEVKE